jgi:iron complex transport system substrate-binding protein
MRIVSLLSSATEIVHRLGLLDRLVGISHECDDPPEALGLPRVSRSRFDPAGLTSGEIDAAVRRSMVEHGSVYEVDARLLESLRPDLVLTQAVCEVCAVPTGSVEAAIAGIADPPRVLSLDSHTLEEIIDSVRQVADAAGAAESGAREVARIRARLEAVDRRVSGRPRPRVLMLEWIDPPFAPGHWVPEMVRRAGGDLLLGEPGLRSEAIDPDRLAGLDPDVVLIEPCGFDLERAREDAELHRETLERIAPRAVAAGNAWLLHSAFFSRSGPRVVEGIEALAELLHPTDRSATLDGVAMRW